MGTIIFDTGNVKTEKVFGSNSNRMIMTFVQPAGCLFLCMFMPELGAKLIHNIDHHFPFILFFSFDAFYHVRDGKERKQIKIVLQFKRQPGSKESHKIEKIVNEAFSWMIKPDTELTG